MSTEILCQILSKVTGETLLCQILSKATGETLYMVLISTFIGGLIGIPLGILLYATKPGNFLSKSAVYYVLAIIVNIGRAVPFVILALYITPFTMFSMKIFQYIQVYTGYLPMPSRPIMGTTIGNTAIIIPLAVSAIPFIARMIENIISEVPKGLIEASQAMGASALQIISKVLLRESLSGIISAMTVVLITMIGASAMAGFFGAGGLGQVAYSYGYQQYNFQIMNWTVIVTVIMVICFQAIGDFLSKKSNHR